MIYVHVPYCRSFCKYCDFYSERSAPRSSFVDEICREIALRRDEIKASEAIDTLYFGGGTPSVLPLPYLERIASACGKNSYREWTMEVNPDDITPEYAAGLAALGVNRVSMGVQSLDDALLGWMNRRHDAAGARRAFDALRGAGFGNISTDLIFGISGLTAQMLRSTLEGLLQWRPEHISAYQLSVEEGSALGRLAAKGRYREMEDSACRMQYELICRTLAEAGYEHYEISNWALPGFRAVHNSAYWTRAPYAGFGPGAHSLRIDGALQVRSWNSQRLSGWTGESETLTAEEIRTERIMLGLRTADGVEASLLPEGAAEECRLAASELPGRLRIPEENFFVSDDIISTILSIFAI